jgi:hypothetical protein
MYLPAICISMLQQCNQTPCFSGATGGLLPEVRVTRKLKFWKQLMLMESKEIKHLIVLCDCEYVFCLKKSLENCREIKNGILH